MLYVDEFCDVEYVGGGDYGCEDCDECYDDEEY